MRIHHLFTRTLIVPVIILLLSYGIARSIEPFNSLKYPAEAYIKLVNESRSYPTVTLYVDGNSCGSAPQGDYCVCPVSPGSHNLKAVGVDSAGKTGSATRTETVSAGQTYTWHITG